MFVRILTVALLSTLAVQSAFSDFVLQTSDTGEFLPDGRNDPTSITARVGQASFTLFNQRAYFYFNTAAIADNQRVQAATLSMELVSYLGDASEIFSLCDVTTAWTDINRFNSTTTGLPIWNDLGDGNVYAQATVNASQQGSVLQLTLNQFALDDLNSSIVGNGEFIIGFRIDTLTGADLLTFESSASSNTPHFLTLTTTAVPEPTQFAMLAITSMILIQRKRRSR